MAGLVFVGFLIIGLGFGLLFNKTAVGVLIGLGLGFLGMFCVKWKKQ